MTPPLRFPSLRPSIQSTPGSAAAPLLHWLVLLGGLALLTTGRVVESDTIVPTCMGAVLGTATGQLFAWVRLRVWAALLALTCLISICAMCLWNIGGSPAAIFEAFIPAAACGYLSLTARGALAALWFPAVPWSLAIIEADASDANRASGLPLSAAIWVGLGGLLVAALWARETRRVAQWKTHALGELAEPPRRVVLHQAPLRAGLRALWAVAVGGATIFLAAWIAPQLRQWEAGEDDAGSGGSSSVAQPASIAANDEEGGWVTCCPDAPPPHVPTRRVREYIEPRPKQETDVPSPAPLSCVACTDGVPVRRAGSAQSDVARKVDGPHHYVDTRSPYRPNGGPLAGEPTAIDPSVDGPTAGGDPPIRMETDEPRIDAVQTGRSGRSATDDSEPEVVAHAGVTDPRAVPPRPAYRPPPTRVAPHPASPYADPETEGDEPTHSVGSVLSVLLALFVAAFAVNLGLRPVRRWFVLRHLHRPWWEETVSQRVSNLWQLALIGLRDAGWHAESGEQPQELARRVGIDGMQKCADVLERARHGVRVDAADLAAMEQAAAAAFRAARVRAGALARVASWWRAPVG